MGELRDEALARPPRLVRARRPLTPPSPSSTATSTPSPARGWLEQGATSHYVVVPADDAGALGLARRSPSRSSRCTRSGRSTTCSEPRAAAGLHDQAGRPRRPRRGGPPRADHHRAPDRGPGLVRPASGRATSSSGRTGARRSPIRRRRGSWPSATASRSAACSSGPTRASRSRSTSPPTFPEARGLGVGVALTEHALCVGARAGPRPHQGGLADREPARLALLAEARLPADRVPDGALPAPRSAVILREPANALDPRMRAYWTVESLLATRPPPSHRRRHRRHRRRRRSTAAWVVGRRRRAGRRRASASRPFVTPAPRLPQLPLRGHRARPLRRQRLALAPLAGGPARPRADRGHDGGPAPARVRARRRSRSRRPRRPAARRSRACARRSPTRSSRSSRAGPGSRRDVSRSRAGSTRSRCSCSRAALVGAGLLPVLVIVISAGAQGDRARLARPARRGRLGVLAWSRFRYRVAAGRLELHSGVLGATCARSRSIACGASS